MSMHKIKIMQSTEHFNIPTFIFKTIFSLLPTYIMFLFFSWKYRVGLSYIVYINKTYIDIDITFERTSRATKQNWLGQ